jgi:xanthine dehydrogenase small subunit
MAATPVRAAAVEQALIGEDWTETNVAAAMNGLSAALTPISDMRAGAAYRSMVAQNLLFKFFLETTAAESRTRLESAA